MEDYSIADSLGVNISHKNRELQTVCEKTYGLREYAGLIGLDIKRIILDVEDMVYRLEDNRRKDDWDDETLTSFARIRHKLLDRAGDIERLVDNLYVIDEQVKVKPEAMEVERDKSGVTDFFETIFRGFGK